LTESLKSQIILLTAERWRTMQNDLQQHPFIHRHSRPQFVWKRI